MAGVGATPDHPGPGAHRQLCADCSHWEHGGHIMVPAPHALKLGDTHAGADAAGVDLTARTSGGRNRADPADTLPIAY